MSCCIQKQLNLQDVTLKRSNKLKISHFKGVELTSNLILKKLHLLGFSTDR